MTQNGKANLVEVVEGNLLIPSPTPRSRLHLSTVRDCRRELAKVYIATRKGEIETGTATRLAYILTSLSNMIRDSEIEERIAALELRK